MNVDGLLGRGCSWTPFETLAKHDHGRGVVRGCAFDPNIGACLLVEVDDEGALELVPIFYVTMEPS